MKCIRIPGAILSVPDCIGQHVMVGGKKVFFDFDEQFGPLVTGPHGEERKQPGERSPFWGPFNAWLKDYREKQQIAAAMRPPRALSREEQLDKSAAHKVRRDD